MFSNLSTKSSYFLSFAVGPGRGGSPYKVYKSTCGLSAVLVINRVSIFAILVINRVWFLRLCLELGMFFFIINDKIISQSPSKIMLRVNVPAATVIISTSNFWLGHK